MKYKLFVLTILASVGFFNYHAMLSEQIIKAIFYLNVLICFAVAMRDGVSLKEVDYPRKAFLVLISGIAFSAIMATAFHSQSLVTSVITTLPYLFAYSLFWIWMKFDIPRQKVINSYMVLCAISTVVYFCNVATVPFNMFGEPIINEDLTRGIVRLPVVFIEMFPLLVFYSINQWLITKEKRWLFIIAWAMVMIFLSVIRQIIALTLVLGGWFFFRKISTGAKIALCVAALGVVVFVLPQIPIYKAMIELSEDQRDENDDVENIRITAWKYYTYENQTNAVTAILGNGMPAFGNSLWGKMMDSETEVTGCLFGDVGWAGFYWLFGIISTGALLIILIKATIKRKPEDQQYLTYWLLYVIITSVASAPIIYFYQVVYVVTVLYLVYKSDNDNNTELEQGQKNNRLDVKKRDEEFVTKYPQLN